MGLFLGGKGDFEKIYRGAYDYFRGKDKYCEETFDVYENEKGQFYKFDAKITSRVSTGELLNVSVEYVMSYKFVLMNVEINKNLGNQKSTEIYFFDPKENNLLYKFIGTDSEKEEIMPITYKFFVSSPAACTSMLFMKTKKFNSTSKNNYNIISSFNTWSFEKLPQPIGISLERITANKDTVKVGGSNLSAFRYRLIEDSGTPQGNSSKNERPPQLDIHISSHLTIPYLIQSQPLVPEDESTKTRIEIKYLNELNK